MSTIDAVIAQARRPGSFSERRRFTLARTQAIQKLRQFALAEPAGYVLELIQSAVANGASWIEVLREPSSVTVAYIGGGIPESALARLFDYLFASKDDPGLGYLRELAIGVNALLAFEPRRIIIESGDGTRAGTSRMELLAGEDRFEVGRADHTLSGTFIRAEGLRKDRGAAYERDIIETHCLAAPVPIFFNSEAIFGYSRQRVPALPGVGKRISFDEGDLYGTIGVEPSGPPNEFVLLTRGVRIETLTHALIPGTNLAGVICFDGLRKSADHARIVRDERMAEMWLRVTPYARTLLGDTQVHEVLQASAFDGAPIGSVQALQGWLRAARRVVVVPPELAIESPRARTAGAIAEAIGGQLLRAYPEQFASLRILGGSGVELHAPDLGADGPDLEFYRRPMTSPPPRPWLVAPVGAPAVTLAQLQPEPVAAQLATWVGETAELRMRVYTPASSERVETVEVVLQSCGRELGRYALASSLPGHVLVVELPTVAPSQLGARTHALVQEAGKSLAAACLRHAAATLSEAADRLLAGLVDPTAILGPLERARVRTALLRSARVRLRRERDGRPSLCFALTEPGPPGVDLLGLRVFTGRGGGMLSAREVAERLLVEEGWLGVQFGAANDEAAPLFDPFLRVDSREDALPRIVGEGACHWPGEPRREEPAAYDAEGRSYTRQQVEAALGRGRRIVVYHARELPPGVKPGTQVPGELWLPAWSWLRMAPAGALLPAFDFHVDDLEAREHGDEQAFIASAPVAGGELEGMVGVPLASPTLPGVLVIDEGLRHVHRFDVIGHDFGVVGLLRVRGAWAPNRRMCWRRS